MRCRYVQKYIKPEKGNDYECWLIRHVLLKAWHEKCAGTYVCIRSYVPRTCFLVDMLHRLLTASVAQMSRTRKIDEIASWKLWLRPLRPPFPGPVFLFLEEATNRRKLTWTFVTKGKGILQDAGEAVSDIKKSVAAVKKVPELRPRPEIHPSRLLLGCCCRHPLPFPTRQVNSPVSETR